MRARADLLAQDEGEAEDEDQRRGLGDGDDVGDRQAGEGDDVAEHAQRLARRPHERFGVEGAREGAPLAAQDDEDGAGEARRDPAQEQHLEGRQVLGDELHETVADHEGGGRGEHGGDAAEVGSSAHEGRV